MAVKQKRKSKPRSKFRASWKGQLRFGLVSIGVQALNTHVQEGSEVHFHMLHAKCHSRIEYHKVCPIHGEVGNDEIVSGYQYGRNRYVEFDPDELDNLRTESEKALTIDTFIAPDAVDPLYFDGRMYYLLPSGAEAQEAYGVFQEAMSRQERWGVGQIVFSGKEQLVVVRPLDHILHMAMLNYDSEIRKSETFGSALVRPHITPKKLKLAEDLIRNWSDESFDLSDYEDMYTKKVKQLIEAKIEGRDIVAPEEDEEPQVVNLLEALEQSLARAGGEHRRGAKKSKSKTTRARMKRRRAS